MKTTQCMLHKLAKPGRTGRLLFSLVLAMLPLSSVAVEALNQTAQFLALGDSYTIGEGVEKSQRWPELLQANLAEKGIVIAKPVVIARTGWRAAQLLGAINRQQSDKALNSAYALVTLMIGVNDQYQGRTVAQFKPHLEQLISQAIELAGGKPERVLLISIPDWGFSPFARFRGGKPVNSKISQQIDAFNTVLKNAASLYSLNYVDVTSISRQVTAEDFVADGLHPSKQQYQRWLDEAIAPAALRVLAR